MTGFEIVCDLLFFPCIFLLIAFFRWIYNKIR